MSTDALSLNERLSKSIGDWIATTVTANVGADKLVISTNLNQYDNGEDDIFKDWWVYIASQNNLDKDRKVRFYYTANGACNVFGPNLTADTNVADVRVHRFSYTEKQGAINDSLRELYPIIYREVDEVLSSVTNSNVYTYNLPVHMAGGELRALLVNTDSDTSTISGSWDKVWNWTQVNEGRSVRLPNLFASNYNMWVRGIAPINTLSGPSNTIPIDDESTLSLIIAYAKYKFWQNYESPVSSEDVSRYEKATAKAYSDYLKLLPRGRMAVIPTTIKFGGL